MAIYEVFFPFTNDDYQFPLNKILKHSAIETAVLISGCICNINSNCSSQYYLGNQRVSSYKHQVPLSTFSCFFILYII